MKKAVRKLISKSLRHPFTDFYSSFSIPLAEFTKLERDLFKEGYYLNSRVELNIENQDYEGNYIQGILVTADRKENDQEFKERLSKEKIKSDKIKAGLAKRRATTPTAMEKAEEAAQKVLKKAGINGLVQIVLGGKK